MKKEKIRDERVVAQQRQVGSEAYNILMIALLSSIFVKQWLLGATFSQYIVEVVCCFGVTVYVIIRYWMLGLNLYRVEKKGKRIPFVSAVITGSIVAIMNGISNYKENAEYYANHSGLFIFALIIMFLSSAIVTFSFTLFIHYLNEKIQMKTQRQLDENEQED